MSARVELYRENIDTPEMFHEQGGKWRWRFVKNSHIMADSGQGYVRRIDCLNACATVLGGVVGEPFASGTGAWLNRYAVWDGPGLPPIGDRIPWLDGIPIHDLTRSAS